MKATPEFWQKRIKEMLRSGEYDWAADTLEGILEDVSEKGRISEKQRDAIQNIKRGGQRL